MKINGQQQSNCLKFLLGSAARVMSPSRTELMDRESIQDYKRGVGVSGRSLTLDRLGVLLDLTMGSAADHIPHYDLPRGISWSQPQTVRRAQVVVVVFPGPFHLPNTKHSRYGNTATLPPFAIYYTKEEKIFSLTVDLSSTGLVQY